jgi:hypothetical protein
VAAITQVAALALKMQNDRRVQRPVVLAWRSASPLLVALARGRDAASPRAPAAFTVDPEQLELGEALAMRVAEVTRMAADAAVAAGLPELASGRLAKPINDVHKVATRAIARFLVTGQGTTEIERNFTGRVGVMAAVFGLSITTLTRSYVLWRDCNLRVLNEEVRRLGISLAVYDQARRLIRSTSETGIKRMVLAYEDHVRASNRRLRAKAL